MRPGAIETPLTKIVIDDAMRRQIMRDHAPSNPPANDIEDTVENLSFGIRFGSSSGFGRWDERFEEAPLSIAQVCRIRFSRFHAAIVPQTDAVDQAFLTRSQGRLPCTA